jgi:hypothetical protein
MDDINNNIGVTNVNSAKRPKFVTSFAIVFIFFAFIFIALGWFSFFLEFSATQSPSPISSGSVVDLVMRFATGLWISGVILVIWGLFNFIISYGFFKGFKWGFWLGVIDLILVDIFAILFAFVNLSSLLGIAVDIYILYILFKRQDIKDWFVKTGGYKVLIIGLIIIAIIGFFVASTNSPSNTNQGVFTYNQSSSGQYQMVGSDHAKGTQTKGDGCSVYSSSSNNITCQKAVLYSNGMVELSLSQSLGHPVQTYQIFCQSAGGTTNSDAQNFSVNNIKLVNNPTFPGVDVDKNFIVDATCYNKDGTSSFQVGQNLNSFVEISYVDRTVKNSSGLNTGENSYIFINTTAMATALTTNPTVASFCNSNNQCVAGGTGTSCATDSDCRTAPVWVSITSPQGGEQWAQGSNKTITWNSKGLLPSDHISIYVYNGTGPLIYLANNILLGNSTSYKWIIPASAPVGSNYKLVLQVIDRAKPDYSMAQCNSNNFSIVTPQ